MYSVGGGGDNNAEKINSIEGKKKVTIAVDLCTLKINSSTFKFIPIQ